MTFEKPVQPKFRVQRVDKPWGHEILWAFTDRYVGKILHVAKGESLSLQFHEVKDETLSVLTGSVLLEHGQTDDDLEEWLMEPGDCFRVTPGTRHRLTAREDTDLLEASTPELADVIRLQDRYGREGTSSP